MGEHWKTLKFNSLKYSVTIYISHILTNAHGL